MKKLACIAAIFLSACGQNAKKPPPQFNESAIKETARWAGEIIAPLDSSRTMGNGIVRADTVKSETEKILAKTLPLVGKQVSWGMGCDVYETRIVVSNCTFSADAGNLTYDMFHLVHERKFVPVLKVLDDGESDHYQSDPNKRPFELRVPEQIARDDAAKIENFVTVAGTISRIEISKFEDDRNEQRFLILIYLDDIKLTPRVYVPDMDGQ